MDRLPDNANPTILSLSELPTRKNKQRQEQQPKRLLSEYFDQVYRPLPDVSLAGILGIPPPGSVRIPEPEPIDEQEIYDHISTISDPEHPLSLGQLAVVNLPDIHIDPPPSAGPPAPDQLVRVLVEITPTITHCSLATVIGLGVRVRLERVLPPGYRVDVRIKAGTHSQDDQVNKQLADKERVAAALENDTLSGVLDKMLETCRPAAVPDPLDLVRLLRPAAYV